MRRVAALLAVLAAGAALSACTTSRTAPNPTATLDQVAGWHEIEAPAAGARVIVLSRLGDALLALGSVPAQHGGRAPAAWTTRNARTWDRLTLTAVTGYGQQAEFIMAGVAGTHIAAFGQAYGGAHSNPRPTLWNGGASALAEHEQVFTMFGGEDAISVNGEAARAGTVLLAGGWDGASGRYGAAVWTSPDGARWTRYADVPGLASAPGEQTTALGAAPTRDGFVLLGDTVRSSPGRQRTTALAWTSTDARSWHRRVLPSSGPATASRAECNSSGCLLIGNTAAARQHLLCWTLDAAGRARAGAPGPGSGLVQVRQTLAHQRGVYVVSDVDRVARLDLVSPGCGSWTRLRLPVHTQDAALGSLGSELVLATGSAGASRLWVHS